VMRLRHLATHQLLSQALEDRLRKCLGEDVCLLLGGRDPLQLHGSLLHRLCDEVILDVHVLRTVNSGPAQLGIFSPRVVKNESENKLQ